ncbi:MAG: hypothetical protein AB1791_00550 [Chloroflexota bacterium]
MKHTSRLIIILALLLLGGRLTQVATAAHAGELVHNGSFEADANGDGLPDEWSVSQIMGLIRQDCQLALSGSCSLVVFGVGGPVTIYQSVPQGGQAGDTYTFSLWSAARQAAATGPLQAGVRIQYRDGSAAYFMTRLNAGSHGWQSRTIQVVAAADYNSLTVYAFTGPLLTGQVYVDNVQLTAEASPSY